MVTRHKRSCADAAVEAKVAPPAPTRSRGWACEEDRVIASRRDYTGISTATDDYGYNFSYADHDRSEFFLNHGEWRLNHLGLPIIRLTPAELRGAGDRPSWRTGPGCGLIPPPPAGAGVRDDHKLSPVGHFAMNIRQLFRLHSREVTPNSFRRCFVRLLDDNGGVAGRMRHDTRLPGKPPGQCGHFACMSLVDGSGPMHLRPLLCAKCFAVD